MKNIYRLVLIIETNKLNKVDDLAKKLGKSTPNTSTLVKRLINNKVVERKEYNIYHLTPLGKQVAKAIKKMNEVNFLESEK